MVRLLSKIGAGRSPEEHRTSADMLYVLYQAPMGPQLFYEKPAILRRLRRHPLPKEGGYGSLSCTTGDTNANPVTKFSSRYQ